MPKTERAVVVTTIHRGVFFGYAIDTTGKSIELKRARLCIYGSEEQELVDDEPEPEPECCPYCGKPYEDFSDLGCGRCDRRSPEWGIE